MEEKLHIGISVKDFKAIVMHAETLKTTIQALYSFPTRPMQATYQEHGMLCEFTLMTIGEYRGGSVTPAPAVARNTCAAPSGKQPSRQSSVQTNGQQMTNPMPPPAQPASRSFTREPPSQRPQRPSPPPPKASLDPESLFLPAANEDDRQWDERNYDDDQDTLGWDASADSVCKRNRRLKVLWANNVMQDPFTRSSRSLHKDQETASKTEPDYAWPEDDDRRIAPTQRLSEVFQGSHIRRGNMLIAVQIHTLFEE